jgi:uncharacterized membrane protein
MMAAPPRPARRRITYPLRVIRSRPRLFICIGIAIACTATLPADWRLATRLLVGWDIAVAIYLALIYFLFSVSDPGHIRRRSKIEDEGRIMVLVLTASAAVAMFGAIIAELGAAHGVQRAPLQLALATTTIVLSWGFTHTIFALHYAHEYYDEDDSKGGLKFPGNDEPDYWDFVYFAFVIGMTSQVSDVAVASKPIRRTVNAHGVVSFFFNAALLALTVNIAASAI